MIAEILNKNDINDNNNNIYFSYDEYKGALYNKLDFIKEIKQLFKNIILYINPDTILNGLVIGKTIYRDEPIYNIFDSKTKQSDNTNTYYRFNYNQDISNIVQKQNSLVSFIMNNHGLNYIILNIESIYNYLLVGNMNNIHSSELEIM
jgi:alpha-amylase/alpha-mannosidase (GH57 family)